MTFASRLTRCPIPFDPARGQEARARFAGLAPELQALIAGAAGCSPYLGGLLQREAEWIEAALAGQPEAALDAALAGLGALGSEALAPALRQAKARVALLAGLADLGGVWPLEAVTGALTRLGFAGLSVRQGKRFEIEVEGDLTEERLEQIRQAAETMLANTVIEAFDVRVDA